MLQVNLNEDCNEIRLSLPDYPASIGGDNIIFNLDNPTDQCCTRLEIQQNCCENTTTTYYLRHLYNLGVTIADCGQELVADLLLNYIDFTVTGIDSSCTYSVEYTNFSPVGGDTLIASSTPTFRVYFGIPQSTYNFNFDIRTCSENLLYNMTFTLNIPDPGNFCDNPSISNINVTYPDLPTGLTIDTLNNELVIVPELLNQSNTFLDGVYFFSLIEDSQIETESQFFDCNVKCKVVDEVSENLCSDIFLMYEALVYSNECPTISYQQQCDLWKYIGKQLKYFENDPCTEPSDCGCNH